ncbi:TIGR01777 family oxidoreductase [Motilimonas cestriensis]|uniref:TIGR01777 family oxidoreductase n=1 Tax=Motilimonas cestriensis TaxID=2742685 RepID=A0ABS8W380_9GAMM|nr:TIGR01777 family oxidoreductase [Motilimonas cestriensis]MCE2593394.1 TIGR01777 family oxidoreductase [Motilimonas cestriensis]
MNILITGGTGLIGQRLCKVLNSAHQLTVLSRSKHKAHSLLGSDITIIEDLASLTNLNQFDAVINLAGEPIAEKRWTEKQKHAICQSRWTITQQLVELFKASDHAPKTFISGSAIGIYGRQNAQPITEDFDQYNQEFSHTICQQWEDIANQAQPHTRVCNLRTGIVLSQQGGALKKMLPPFKMGVGGRIGSGQQFMSWIHIDDMVNGIIWLLEHDALSGAFNFTAPKPVTNKTFSLELAATLNRPAFCPVPATVLKVLLGEMSDLLLYGQNVLPEKLSQSGYQFKHPDIKEALQDLLSK